jgi:hypothetical protein
MCADVSGQARAPHARAKSREVKPAHHHVPEAKSPHRLSCLRLALRTLATTQERRHAATIPRSDEPRPVLDLAGNTKAGIDQGFEAGSIGHKKRDARLTHGNAFRGRDWTKSSQEMGRCYVVESNQAYSVSENRRSQDAQHDPLAPHRG